MSSVVCYPESNWRSFALQCKRKKLQRTKLKNIIIRNKMNKIKLSFNFPFFILLFFSFFAVDILKSMFLMREDIDQDEGNLYLGCGKFDVWGLFSEHDSSNKSKLWTFNFTSKWWEFVLSWILLWLWFPCPTWSVCLYVRRLTLLLGT